jgi:hypothetical protein
LRVAVSTATGSGAPNGEGAPSKSGPVSLSRSPPVSSGRSAKLQPPLLVLRGAARTHARA